MATYGAVSTANNGTNGAPTQLSFEDAASPFGKVVFSYLNPLLQKGSKEGINHEDLGATSLGDSSYYLYTRFKDSWELERKKPPEMRSMWYTLWRTVGYWKLVVAIGLFGLYGALSYGPVMILNVLVRHFQGTAVLDTAKLWILVVMIFVFPVVGSIAAAHSNMMVSRLGIQFRNCLVNMIYRKSLRLSSKSRQQMSTGMIVNMFSSDTQQIQRFLLFLNNSIIAPFQIIASLVLIYFQVGVATFVGLAFMLILVPFNGVLFQLIGRIRQRKVEHTDNRVRLMNEVLGGIRILKYYAWEAPFEEKVNAIRHLELIQLRQMAYLLGAGITLIFMAAPIIQPILIFITYISLGNQLDAATAFTTIALFNMMSQPFAFLPLGVQSYIQSRVSTARMLKFFDADEVEDYVKPIEVSAPKQPSSTTPGGAQVPTGGKVAARLQNVSTCWTTEEDIAVEKEKRASEKSSTKPSGKEASYAKVATVADDESKKKKEKTPGDNSEGDIELGSMAAAEVAPAVVKAETTQINRSAHTLIDASVEIMTGELIAVVGAVGSGKTSFLCTLLGEMHLQQGTVELSGSVAYCDQRPWILNDTVKNNILFGEEFNEERFEAALRAASLNDDMKVLPGGVMTEIGERGINLSGGQKARVALARAVYKNCDVYMLDDPLSAVDAHVGQYLFNDCIKGNLAGKTRILVTHQLHVLPGCDRIIVLDNGKISGIGTYHELCSVGLLDDHTVRATAPKEEEEDEDYVEEDEQGAGEEGKTHDGVSEGKENEQASGDSAAPRDRAPSASRERAMSSRDRAASGARKRTISSAQKEPEAPKPNAGALIAREERNLGDVDKAVYYYYIKSGGLCWVLLIVFGLVSSQVLTILSNFYLAYWGEVTSRHNRDGNPLSSSENIKYFQIYAAISMVGVALVFIRSMAMAEHRMNASTTMHSVVLTKVFNAPIAFFDVTPLGRILNRFSSDLNVIDEDLSQTLSQIANVVGACLAGMGAIAGATKGTFLLIMIPLWFIYQRTQYYYRKTNTTVARLESVSRSPIYADFSQALNGVTSIRAYKDGNRFIQSLEERVDKNTVALVISSSASNWLAIRLDLLGALSSFFVAVLTVSSRGWIPSSFLALGLAYSFTLTGLLKMAVRVMATSEAQMNAVERLIYYMTNITQEDEMMDEEAIAESKASNRTNVKALAAVSGNYQPKHRQSLVPIEDLPQNWPQHGDIVATNISMRYRDGPLVLKNVSFHVKGGEKVGVCGRTGSGKSSLMVGLFRIENLATGTILIDNVDIKNVPVRHLRKKLGIIPQDPVLFSTSVRFNLDPFSEYSDAELWEVLEQAQLKKHVSSMPGKLDEGVAEGGENFSAGQRQLLCIARALLRRPKILVLDEATASIDNDTDELLQTMIRKCFVDSTVLTIAHRLHTIYDSNRIMVLDNGNLAEFDAVDRLLAKENGLFKSLWEKHQASHGQQ